MPAAGQLHIQSRQMGLSVFIRSFGIHIKVHKLSSTRRPRTIHTWHVTVGRLRCRLQACREFHGGGTQQCWLLHSCALVMTVATSGRVSALRGGLAAQHLQRQQLIWRNWGWWWWHLVQQPLLGLWQQQWQQQAQGQWRAWQRLGSSWPCVTDTKHLLRRTCTKRSAI